MFTGLIEEVGQVSWLRRTTTGTQLQVTAPGLVKGLRKGDSIAVNGCCLTVASSRGEFIAFDLLQETLDRTNLHRLRPGTPVNLERALAATARLGGHFVQGHIDCVSPVAAMEKKGDDHRLEVAVPVEFAHLLVYKGSIAINGISLTVAGLSDDHFSVWIIPHTREHTNLRAAQAGDLVNLEFDILGKYVERILGRRDGNAAKFIDQNLS